MMQTQPIPNSKVTAGSFVIDIAKLPHYDFSKHDGYVTRTSLDHVQIEIMYSDVKTLRKSVGDLLSSGYAPTLIYQLQDSIICAWQMNELLDIAERKAYNSRLALVFGGQTDKQWTESDNLPLPIYRVNPKWNVKQLYVSKKSYSSDDLSELLDKLEPEGKSTNNKPKKTKAKAPLRFYPSYDETLPRLNLPEIIDEFFPDAKVNLPHPQARRCVAVWRSGRNRNVSLKLKPDGIWYFKDFKTGEGGNLVNFLSVALGMDGTAAHAWIYDRLGISNGVTAEERTRFEEEAVIRAHEAEKRIAEEKKIQTAKLQEVEVEWESYQLEGTSDYLSAKGLPVLKGVRFGKTEKDASFIALRITNATNDFCGEQRIFDWNAGKYIREYSIIKRCFILIGADKLPKTTKKSVHICEGYATGAAIYKALGGLVICSLFADNLFDVTNALRKHFGAGAKLTLFADNDQWLEVNVGVNKAKHAANKREAQLVVPDFTGLDTASLPTDFADLSKLAGFEAIKEQYKLQTEAK